MYYDSLLTILNDMTQEELAAYWRGENIKDNRNFIKQMHNSIQMDEGIIKGTQDWLRRCVERTEDNEKLKSELMLGAELIQGCEQSILITRAEIAHYIKYPLYSDKRREWYKTREGKQWHQKNLAQLKKK